MVLLQKKLYFSKDPEGSNIFQGVQLFPGGVGGPDPLSPPLDLHMSASYVL